MQFYFPTKQTEFSHLTLFLAWKFKTKTPKISLKKKKKKFFSEFEFPRPKHSSEKIPNYNLNFYAKYQIEKKKKNILRIWIFTSKINIENHLEFLRLKTVRKMLQYTLNFHAKKSNFSLINTKSYFAHFHSWRT